MLQVYTTIPSDTFLSAYIISDLGPFLSPYITFESNIWAFWSPFITSKISIVNSNNYVFNYSYAQ